MPEATTRDLFQQELLDLLKETFEETQGIYLDRGTSIFETLAAFTAAQASKQLSEAGATVAGHTEHMAYYLEVLRTGITGETLESVDWQASWRIQSVSEEAWRILQDRLRTAYQETICPIRAHAAWKGEDDLGGALAMLAHSASHLGAIRQAIASGQLK